MAKNIIKVRHTYSGDIEVPVGELVRVYLDYLIQEDRASSKKRLTHCPRNFGIVLAPGGCDSRGQTGLFNDADIIIINWNEPE